MYENPKKTPTGKAELVLTRAQEVQYDCRAPDMPQDSVGSP